MKKPKTLDPEKLRKWYEEELKRKDEMIDKLKRENVALLKSALDQGLKLSGFEAKLRALAKKKK